MRIGFKLFRIWGQECRATASTKATPSPSSPFSTTMVDDMFSRTDDIKCFSCNELVNFGDDYEAHLQVVHRVTKNFSFYMSKALEQKKFQKNPVEIEVVEMSDSEPEDNDGDAELSEEVAPKVNLDELSKAAEQTTR